MIKTKNVLLVNDDGIMSQGISIMQEILSEIFDNVWIVAPETNQSGVGHAISLNTPVRIFKQNDMQYTTSGTPTDCVLLGVYELLKNVKVDMIVSGMNEGYNMANDITQSGTIGAAIEGTLHNIPSIAISMQSWTGKKFYKDSIKNDFMPDIINKLINYNWPKMTFYSINIPNIKKIKGIKITKQGYRKGATYIHKVKDHLKKDSFWIGSADRKYKKDLKSDLPAVENGFISITPLTIEMTKMAEIENLQKHFQN